MDPSSQLCSRECSCSSLSTLSPQVDQSRQPPSPDSPPKQLTYSVEQLLCQQKSIQENTTGSGPDETFVPSSSHLSTPSATSSASLNSMATLGHLSYSSNYWSNLNRLAHTFWWQRPKCSSLPSDTHPHHQLDSGQNFLSRVTMASATSLYLPHLRRFIFPLTSTTSASHSQNCKQTRRHRTTFSYEQTLTLEMEYHVSEYISRSKRFQLADLLDLTENQIKIWFQNRRAKDKRIEKELSAYQFGLLTGPNSLPNHDTSSGSN